MHSSDSPNMSANRGTWAHALARDQLKREKEDLEKDEQLLAKWLQIVKDAILEQSKGNKWEVTVRDIPDKQYFAIKKLMEEDGFKISGFIFPAKTTQSLTLHWDHHKPS